MGKVYRVEDTKIREEVALKLIKPEISSDKKTIERFSNELRLTRKIVHNNVGRMIYRKFLFEQARNISQFSVISTH